MRIYSRDKLQKCSERHSDSRDALESWIAVVSEAEWDRPADVIERFPSASILPNNRVVFRIKGNAYRLVVEINYETGDMFIRFLDTHAAYDGIDAVEV